MRLPTNQLPTRLAAVGLTAVLAIGLTACSSSSKAPAASSPAASTPAVTTPAATTASTGTDVTSAVTQAYQTALNYQTPAATVETLLQDGADFTQAIAGLAAQAQSTKLSVTVSTVTPQGANAAKVVFTIFTNGSATVKDTPGYAVLEDGTWKVAGITFCGLVSLAGTPPAACMTAKATTIPS